MDRDNPGTPHVDALEDLVQSFLAQPIRYGWIAP
jgi:hypothetical protein